MRLRGLGALVISVGVLQLAAGRAGLGLVLIGAGMMALVAKLTRPCARRGEPPSTL